MDRAFASGASGVAPSVPASPSVGYPTSGNPGAAIPATKPGEWWYHMVTEEIRKVIIDAGLTPAVGNLTQLSAAIQLLISGAVVPAGTVVFVAKSSAPAGYLKANGAAISRTTYASLFSSIGTVFGAGDGSTTFNLPDLRGEFIRGFDDGRAVDSGRAIGSAQTDAFKSHTHTAGVDVYAGLGSGGLMYYISGSGVGPTGATGGTETRPRNVALLACIRY